MTKGSKYPIPQSLTTPALRATPPMEGNLVRYRRETVTLYDGWGCFPSTIAEQSSPLRRGGARQRAGVVYHP